MIRPRYDLFTQAPPEVLLHPSDCCSKCKRVLTAAELRAWRDEFGIAADEEPHMPDTPSHCTACADELDVPAYPAPVPAEVWS